MVLALILIVVAMFTSWIHIHDYFALGTPVYSIHVGVTYINVWFPQGQDFARHLERGLALTSMMIGGVHINHRTAEMSGFHDVRSWSQFVGVACGYLQTAREGDYWQTMIRQMMTGDVCTPAYWTQFFAVMTGVALACAGLFALLSIVQFYTGAILRRSKSFIFPMCAFALLIITMVMMSTIGFMIFDLFDAERMFFPSTAFFLAFIATLASGLSACMGCSQSEEDLDFEEFLEDKEEEEYLMHKQAQQQASWGYGQHAQQAYGQQAYQQQGYAQPYAQQPYAQQPSYAGTGYSTTPVVHTVHYVQH